MENSSLDLIGSKQLAFSCQRGDRSHETEYFHQLTTHLDSLIRQVEVNIAQALSRLHVCLVANAERVFCLEQMQTKAFYSPRREKKTARKLLHMTSVKRRREFVVAVQKKQICLPSSRPDKNTLLKILEQMGKQKDSNQNSKQKIDERSQIYFRSSSEIWSLSQRRARTWNVNKRSQKPDDKLSGRYLGCLPQSYPLQPRLHIIRNIGNGQYLILKKTDADRCVLKNKPQKCFNFPVQLNGTRQPKVTFRNIENVGEPREYSVTKNKELNKWISKMTSQTYLSHARSQPQLSIRNIEINPEKNKFVSDETKGFSKYFLKTKSPAFFDPLSNCATTVSQIGSTSGNSETNEQGGDDLSVRGLGINGLLKINTQSFGGTPSGQSRSGFMPKLVVRKPMLSETETESLIALGKGVNTRISKSCPYLRSLTRSFNFRSNLRIEDMEGNEDDLVKIESLQVERNICSMKKNEDKDKHFGLENTEFNQYNLEKDPHDSYYLTHLLAQPKSPNIERKKEEINIFAERIDICNTVLQPNGGISNTNENKEDSCLKSKEMKKFTSASRWQQQFKSKDSWKQMRVTFADIEKNEEKSKDLWKGETTGDSLDLPLLVCKVLNRHNTDDRGESGPLSGNKTVGRNSLTYSRRYVKYMPPKPTFSVPNIPNQDRKREESFSKITIVNKSLSHHMVIIPNIKTEKHETSSVPQSEIMNRNISQQKHRIPGIRNEKPPDVFFSMTKATNKGIFRVKMPNIKKVKEHNNALTSNTNITKPSIPDIDISCERGNDLVSQIKESNKCISKTMHSYLTSKSPRHKLVTSNIFKEKRRISFKKDKSERYQPRQEIPRVAEIQEKSDNTVSKGEQISHAHSKAKVVSPSFKRKESKYGDRILASKKSTKCGSRNTIKRTQSSKQKLGNVSIQKHGEKKDNSVSKNKEMDNSLHNRKLPVSKFEKVKENRQKSCNKT